MMNNKTPRVEALRHTLGYDRYRSPVAGPSNRVSTSPLRRSAIQNSSGQSMNNLPKTPPRVEALRLTMGRNRYRSPVAGPSNRVSTTPLRRSVIQQNSSDQSDIGSNDDDLERSSRLAEVVLRKSVSGVAHATSSPIVELSRLLGQDEVIQHLKNGLQLFTENKINRKNVWNLQVIDALVQLVSNYLQPDFFQLATMSLEVGGRIYALRVDDVYNMCLQLASRMAKVNVDGEETEEADQSGAPSGVQRKRRRKTKQKNVHTVDNTRKLSYAPLQKIDSRLFTVRENIDCTSNENLFTSKLRFHQFGHCFKILSDDKFWVDPSESEVAGLTYKIPFPENYNLPVCNLFEGFMMDDLNPEDPKLVQDAVVLDENGLPIPELDGSIRETFQNVGDDEALMTDEEEIVPEGQREMHHVVDVLPEEFRAEHEYAFNNATLRPIDTMFEKMWAGPYHWKVKAAFRLARRYTGSVQHVLPQKRRKKKKQPTRLDLSEESRFRFMPELLKKIVERKIPPNDPSHVSFPMRTLFVREEQKNVPYYWTKHQHTKIGTVRHGTNDGNEGNPVIENPPHCAEQPMGTADDVDDDGVGDDDNHGPLENYGGELENFGDDNLIGAPTTIVNAPFIAPFALYAKKTNMKKLKAAIWASISQGDEDDYEILDKNLTTVYKELEEMLSDREMKDITIANIFMAVLDLCNEKQLYLEQIGENRDFIIRKYLPENH